MENELKYAIQAPISQLRQPPELPDLFHLDPHAEAVIKGEFTEAQFAELFTGDLRHFMTQDIETADGWNATVRAEDVLAFANTQSAQERVCDAWLHRNRPQYNEPSATLAHDLERIGVPAIAFLLNLYDLLSNPWEHPDDEFFLEQMESHGIRYEDLAALPPP